MPGAANCKIHIPLPNVRQEMSVEIARLKRQVAEQAEGLAILQKAATYFAKRLK